MSHSFALVVGELGWRIIKPKHVILKKKELKLGTIKRSTCAGISSQESFL